MVQTCNTEGLWEHAANISWHHISARQSEQRQLRTCIQSFTHHLLAVKVAAMSLSVVADVSAKASSASLQTSSAEVHSLPPRALEQVGRVAQVVGLRSGRAWLHFHGRWSSSEG